MVLARPVCGDLIDNIDDLALMDLDSTFSRVYSGLQNFLVVKCITWMLKLTVQHTHHRGHVRFCLCPVLRRMGSSWVLLFLVVVVVGFPAVSYEVWVGHICLGSSIMVVSLNFFVCCVSRGTSLRASVLAAMSAMSLY